jgi:hypothetical protein
VPALESNQILYYWIRFTIETDPSSRFAVAQAVFHSCREGSMSKRFIHLTEQLHIHGHNVLVIGAGIETFEQHVIANANFTIPSRLEVATLPATYIARDLQLNNPQSLIVTRARSLTRYVPGINLCRANSCPSPKPGR